MSSNSFYFFAEKKFHSRENICLVENRLYRFQNGRRQVQKLEFRVRTSSEIKKSRVFQGCFSILSRTFPGPRMKIITFTTSCLKQHLIVNVITVKQQCAPSALFQYWAVVSNTKWYENLQSWLLLIMKSTKCTISRIYFFNKVLWDFPGVSRASKIFLGFPGFPMPVRTLWIIT